MDYPIIKSQSKRSQKRVDEQVSNEWTDTGIIVDHGANQFWVSKFD
jgi:hypothetical protein